MQEVAGITMSGREERVGVVFRDLHDGLMLPARTLEHLILTGIRVARQMSNVGDVHGAGHVIAGITEVPFENILHDVRAEIADVCKMVHGRTAGVHFYDSGRMGEKRVAGMR